MGAYQSIPYISGSPEGSINVNILHKSKTDRDHHRYLRTQIVETHDYALKLSNDLLIGWIQWIFFIGWLTFELYSMYRIVQLSVNSAIQANL